MNLDHHTTSHFNLALYVEQSPHKVSLNCSLHINMGASQIRHACACAHTHVYGERIIQLMGLFKQRKKVKTYSTSFLV